MAQPKSRPTATQHEAVLATVVDMMPRWGTAVIRNRLRVLLLDECNPMAWTEADIERAIRGAREVVAGRSAN